MTTVADLAERYVAGLQGPDVDDRYAELFADSVTMWHNHDDTPTVSEGAAHAGTQLAIRPGGPIMGRLLPDYRFEDIRSHVAEDAFIVTWTICVNLPDGTSIRNPHCSVIHVVDGKITRADDYSDFAQSLPLREAVMTMMAAGEFGAVDLPFAD